MKWVVWSSAGILTANHYYNIIVRYLFGRSWSLLSSEMRSKPFCKSFRSLFVPFVGAQLWFDFAAHRATTGYDPFQYSHTLWCNIFTGLEMAIKTQAYINIHYNFVETVNVLVFLYTQGQRVRRSSNWKYRINGWIRSINLFYVRCSTGAHWEQLAQHMQPASRHPNRIKINFD